MKNENFTRDFADLVVGLTAATYEDIEFQCARIAAADWFSVAIAGVEEPVSRIVREIAAEMGGHEQATIVGSAVRVSALQAAEINGVTSHALDFDDTLTDYLGHPTAVILPALLSLAEWRNISFGNVLTSYLVGLEAGCRLAASAGPTQYMAGWHGTATIGRVAAAAACAHLLGLKPAQTQHALAIAGTEACGVKQSFGTMCKPYHAGIAAEGGLSAALLAAQGLVGAGDLFEGQFGYMALLNGENNPLNDDYFDGRKPVVVLTQKFHAACHCTHAPIANVLCLLDNEGLTADDVDAVDVLVSQVSLDTAGKTELTSGLDGKFSIAYTVARTILTRETGIEAFTDDKVREPAVLDLMKKVSVSVDDKHRDKGLLSTVNIQRKQGDVLTSTYDALAHIPKLEERRERISAKFQSLCTPRIGEGKATALWDLVFDGSNETSVSDLMSLAR